MSLAKMLQKQLELQIEKMKDGDPRQLEGDALADFIRWNAYALEDELHEATRETGWKPWATSRHVNHQRFMEEMVDAFHFFMNLLLAGSGVEDPEELAAWFQELYYAKNAKNARRQDEGYDGISTKCPGCHRDFEEVNPGLGGDRYAKDNVIYCTKECADEHG